MIPSSPSPPACPPKPTASFVASNQNWLVRGLTPSAIMSHTSPPVHAGTTFGMPCESALVTTSGASNPVHKVNVGIGGSACSNVPGLVLISKFRKFPAQINESGVVNDLKAKREAAIVPPTGKLIGPLAIVSVAVQSMTILSPSTVTEQVMAILVSRSIPSLSQ